jgi:hypothetical protein
MKDGKAKQEKVIFRQWDKGCEIIALFPEIATDTLGYHCQSYMHVGQHGAASPRIIEDTKPANLEDGAVKTLIKELTDLGYDLKVIKRFRYKHQEIRMAMYN